MHKLFILIFFISITYSVQSQEFKGTRAVGLILGLSQNNTNNGVGVSTPGSVPQAGISFRVSPEFTYFVSNNWRIGGNLNFEHYNKIFYPNDPSIEFTNKANTVGGAFVATYHHWLSEKIALLFEPSIGFNRAQTELSNQGVIQKDNTNVGFLNANFGVLFIIKKRFGIDLTTSFARLVYASSTIERPNNPNSDFQQNNFTFLFLGGDALSVLSNVSVGLKYFF
ncbi:hypothetical protein BKI52_09485 [marine bacterium AO1-C]|nr:hypothetical protein BKI52_09485 [marine bacterium AO1-C]